MENANLSATADSVATHEPPTAAPVWRWALVLLTVAVSLPFVLNVAADPDLFWHIPTGERILAERTVPQVDTWSFTAVGEQWTNHEWLASVVFTLAYRIADAVGLWVVRTLLFVGIVAGLVAIFAKRLRSPLVMLALLLATVPILGTFINVRAHSFTYALTVWVVVVLDRVRAGRWAWLWVLPPTFALWANLHGGFTLGLALTGLSLLMILFGWDGAVRPVGAEARQVVIAGIATLAATLINPFGPALYLYILDELGAGHVLVSEWQPLAASQQPWFWIYLLVPMGLWVAARRWRHVTLPAMLLITAYSTSQAARFFVLMGLFGAMIAAGALGALLGRASPSGRAARLLGDDKLAVAAVAVLTLIGAVPFVGGIVDGEAGVTVDTELYPIRATEFLSDRPGGNLALTLPYGGYAIWYLADRYKVAVDGRNVTLYDSEWIDSYLLALDEGRALDLLDETEIDAWLLPADSRQIAPLLDTGRWEIGYADDVAVAVIRMGTAEREGAQPIPAGSLRFPGLHSKT